MKEDEGDDRKINDDKFVQDIKLWGVFLFGLIGATATTFALSRSLKGGNVGSFRTTFQEEAWKRYNKRLQEEYEEEMERVERIRRMQDVFNRERNKYRRNPENWKENGSGTYHQNFQRDDWYWKAEQTFRDQWKNYPRDNGSINYSLLSHHYSVLGLDRSRTTPYTDAEIKTAFRTKAKQFHPDQNQEDRVAAEAKFKEVMSSYEAIQQERKNHSL
ncbi:unnamed protein product [Lathyrus oleraceus]|uniref:J domain-containing protein n=2 Tax=Pisum sativum TaxID=3888 RepID=A0A9D4W1N3_PEA|nr:uncharacterized protein LOC127096638 isoform X1 [Pisum sativum]KAI5393408.1 hypothetical protein KIW84_060511 [Pisum sativum]